MTDADAASRPAPTSNEPVGTPENGGRLRCPDHPDRPDTENDGVAENEDQRSVIRDWLARLPPVTVPELAPDQPDVVAARGAWLLQWVEEAWTAWQIVSPAPGERAKPEPQCASGTRLEPKPTIPLEQSR